MATGGATALATGTTAWLPLLVALLSACGREGPGSTGEGAGFGIPRDSSEVVRLPDSLGALPDVLGEREMTIGGFLPDLGPIHWLGAGATGTLAVTQYQDHLVRLLDPVGGELGAVGGSEGRPGVEPGRLRSQGGGGWVGDTLWVNDVTLGRIALYSEVGELLRTLPPLVAAQPLGGEEGRYPVFLTVWPLALYPGDTLLVLAENAYGGPSADAHRQWLHLLRVLPGGQILRDLLQVQEPETEGVIGRGGRPPAPASESPPEAFHHVAPGGDRIVCLDRDPAGGRAWRLQVLDRWGTRVLEKEMVFREGLVPEAVVGGADHRTWILLAGAAPAASWVVLDPEGRPVGRAGLPEASRLLEAGRDHVWVSEVDGSGRFVLARYRATEQESP